METMAGSVTSTMVKTAFMFPLKGSTTIRKSKNCKISAVFGANVSKRIKKSEAERFPVAECIEQLA